MSFPTIHIISDSVGVTARAVARAAAAQFGVTDPKIETYAKVESASEVISFLEAHTKWHGDNLHDNRMVLFYTLVNSDMRSEVETYLSAHPEIIAVDIMTRAVDAISRMTGEAPRLIPGLLYATDVKYYDRIAALEFAINHDDGRNPQDLSKADMVLIGVSRSSKTPLSIYLGQQGYRVANVPLDPTTTPPQEIYQVDSTRLFGLMTTPETLQGIRRRRLHGAEGTVAGTYADLEYIHTDLEAARALMLKLGCIIIRTDNRAIEEAAQEILRYYSRSHPCSTDIID